MTAKELYLELKKSKYDDRPYDPKLPIIKRKVWRRS